MNKIDVAIRDVVRDDAERIAQLLNNKNIWDNLRDYLPYPYDLDDALHFIDTTESHTPRQHKAIINDGILVGMCGIHPFADVYRNTCEIGYWIGEPYWGKNIATHAIAALVEYGKQAFNCIRIEAQVFSSNPASARVLEKNGFQLEGRMKKRITKNDVVMDMLMYALIPGED